MREGGQEQWGRRGEAGATVGAGWGDKERRKGRRQGEREGS